MSQAINFSLGLVLEEKKNTKKTKITVLSRQACLLSLTVHKDNISHCNLCFPSFLRSLENN